MPANMNPSSGRVGGNDDLIRQMSKEILDHERSVQESELVNDNNFLEATKLAYEGLKGEPMPKNATPEEIVKQGLDLSSMFNYNFAAMGADLALIHNATDEQKLGMLYIVDTLDKKDITMEGVTRFFKAAAVDPTNYALGAGIAGRIVAGQAIKSGAKEVLMSGVKKLLMDKYVQAAGAGATFTALDDLARQTLETQANMREGIDPTQTAFAAGVGAVAGPTIVGGVQVAGAVGKAAGKELAGYAQRQDFPGKAQKALDVATAVPQVHKTAGTNAMFVGASPNEPGAFSNIYDKGVRKWIDDGMSQFDQGGLLKAAMKGKQTANLSDVLKHDALYQVYPELKNVQIGYNNKMSANAGAFNGKEIVISTKGNEKDWRSTILHEVQHYIQLKEGWAKGGSANDFQAMVAAGKIPTSMSQEAYRRLAGEQEARAVQAALDNPNLSPYDALKAKEGSLPKPLVKGVNNASTK